MSSSLSHHFARSNCWRAASPISPNRTMPQRWRRWKSRQVVSRGLLARPIRRGHPACRSRETGCVRILRALDGHHYISDVRATQMPVLPFTEGRDYQQGDRWRSVLALPRVRADLEPVATEVRQRTTVTPGNATDVRATRSFSRWIPRVCSACVSLCVARSRSYQASCLQQ